MKTLWFKKCYVTPIKSGEKTDTIRKKSERLPTEGDIISLSVGPRPSFARAKIIKKEIINPATLPAVRKKEIMSIYQDYQGLMVRLYFVLI